MRARLLDAVVSACERIDRLPDWTWRRPFSLVHRLGCPRGLALWAFALAERWGLEWDTEGPTCPDCGEPHEWSHDEGDDDEQPY